MLSVCLIYKHTMESFHIYLPSNACPNIFPNNTASDYETHLNQRLDMIGDWEVGVKSLIYSSHIEEKNEKMQVICEAETQEKLFHNDYDTFKFKLNEHGKWKGLGGIKPSHFEPNPKNYQGVRDTLNKMRAQIFEGEKKSGYSFFEYGYSKHKDLDKFYLKLSDRLVHVLGFPFPIFSNKSYSPRFANIQQRAGRERLTADDYLMQYFYPVSQHLEKRIEIKSKGTSFDGKASTLLSLWSEKDIVFRFSNQKLIIDNYRTDSCITFSPDFAKVTSHYLPLIGRGTTWGKHVVSFSKGHVNEHWYIDIYNTELAYYKTKIETHRFTLDLYPWQHNTLKEVIQHINKEVRNLSQRKFPKLYDMKNHEFKLSLDKNDYSYLVLGSWLKVRFSEKLANLLRVSKSFLQPPEVHGLSRIGQFKNRERQLLILSNIAKTSAYGEKRLQLLQSFLHESNQYDVNEKHFDPILFVPLMYNSIDSIIIQLTTDDYKPINIPDSKTLVCLIFRKVMEKNLM